MLSVSAMLNTVWQSLTVPSTATIEPDQRRQSRLLAALCLALVLLGVLGELLRAVIELRADYLHDQSLTVSLLGLVALITAYILSRTRHFKVGAMLLIGATSLLSYNSAFPANRPNSFYLLDYLIIPVLLCGVLFSLRIVISFVVIQLIAIAAFPWFANNPAFSTAALYNGPLLFNVVGASVIILVLHNRRQLERSRQKSLRENQVFAEALRNTISTLTSTLDFEAVMSLILENVERVVPHHSASIVLINDTKLHIAYWRNYTPEVAAVFEQDVIPDDLSATFRQLAKSGEPLLVSNTGLFPNWKTFPSFLVIKSYIGLPLKSHGKVIGILNMDSSIPGQFTTEHIERLRVFADEAAIAIENAQLYTETRQHAAELEQRVAERTLELTKANQRLQELDRLKSEFIANASHELRTPLTSMNNRLYLIRKHPEQVSDHLDVLGRATKRMMQLTEDLLDTSRLERGVIQLKRQYILLQEVVQEVIEAQQPEAQRKHITLTLHASDQMLNIWADRVRLSQVLLNLVANAINYTPEGGSVDVCTGSESCEAGSNVVIRVMDTGIGIAPENLTRVFEPFFRVNEVAANGTGLGLAITKEIVELHGGTLRVESEVGKGSTFTVFLKK